MIFGDTHMDKSVLSIIFSIVMLPVNLCSSFWIFKEALNISGVTFNEIQEYFSHKSFSRSSKSGRQRIRRMILGYLVERSSNPEKTKKLFRWYLISTLPGLAALLLAEYCAISGSADKIKYVFVGNTVLLFTNIALAAMGRIYAKNNPLDENTSRTLEEKRAKEKKLSVKNIIAIAIIVTFFTFILIMFHLALLGISNSQYTQTPAKDNTQIVEFHYVNTVLSQRGFETANIPTTYWFYNEDKLRNVVSGIKGDTAFEFYEYSDGETTDGVYNSIKYDIAQDMEPNEYAAYETELSGGGKMFAIVQDGVYSVTLYENDTVVYAHSPEESNEIHDILIELGYIEGE